MVIFKPQLVRFGFRRKEAILRIKTSRPSLHNACAIILNSYSNFLVKANLFMENIINFCYSIKVSDSSHRSANFYNIYL